MIVSNNLRKIMSKAVAMLLTIAITVAPLPIMGTHKAIASQSTATLSEFAAWQLYYDEVFYLLQAETDIDIKAKFAPFNGLSIPQSFSDEIVAFLSNFLNSVGHDPNSGGPSDLQIAAWSSMRLSHTTRRAHRLMNQFGMYWW